MLGNNEHGLAQIIQINKSIIKFSISKNQLNLCSQCFMASIPVCFYPFNLRCSRIASIITRIKKTSITTADANKTGVISLAVSSAGITGIAPYREPLPAKGPYIRTIIIAQAAKQIPVKINATIEAFLIEGVVFFERAKKTIKPTGIKAAKPAKII